MKNIAILMIVLLLISCGSENSRKQNDADEDFLSEIENDGEIQDGEDSACDKNPSDDNGNDEFTDSYKPSDVSDGDTVAENLGGRDDDIDIISENNSEHSDDEIDDVSEGSFDSDGGLVTPDFEEIPDEGSASESDADEESDPDSDLPTGVSLKVFSFGGKFDLFGGDLKIVFPNGWIDGEAEVTVDRIQSMDKFTITSSEKNFLKHIQVGVKDRGYRSQMVVARSEGDNWYRLNRFEGDESHIWATTASPATIGIVRAPLAVCAPEMTNVYSEKVIKYGEVVRVDMCMDRYEASLAPIGDVGNADQSGNWAAGCEITATCGDGSTTGLVTSNAGVMPARNLSWYQAAALCQRSGKVLCPSTEWRVACEGAYDPFDVPGDEAPDQLPCIYGVSGDGCLTYREEMCNLKSNYQANKDEFESSQYKCNLEYKYCKKDPATCKTDLDTCLQTAKDEYDATFHAGHYPHCRSVQGANDILGNFWEWILFEKSDHTYERGVLRGGSYVNGGNAQADLTCRPEHDDGSGNTLPGFQIDPTFTRSEPEESTVGFRCCVL